jgi:hypothetical protein
MLSRLAGFLPFTLDAPVYIRREKEKSFEKE